MRRDRARTRILRTSPFGLIEMTRQRIRPSLKRNVFTDCPCCSGKGVVKTEESMSIEVIRLLMVASQNPHMSRVNVRVNDKVAAYLNNRKRREITQLEEEGSMDVQILGTENAFPEFLEIQSFDEQGHEVHLPN